MTNSFVKTVEGANSWVGNERQLLTGETPGQQVWKEVVDKLWPFTEQNLAPIVDQLEIYKDNPQQFSLDWSPVVRNSETNKLEWNKTGLKRLGVLASVGIVVGLSLAACNSLIDNNGGGGVATPSDGDKDNCSWLTVATIGIAGNMNDAASFIGVDSASFANMSQLQADVQCFVPKAQEIKVFTDGDNSIVNIIAPDDLNEGNLRPVWGVVSGDITDGTNQGKLLKLINVSKQDGIKVSRGEDNLLRVDLDSAIVAESQNLGDGDVPSAFLQVEEGSEGDTKVTLKVGDQSISMTRDLVGAQVGGGSILGATDAFQQQETDLKLNSTRAGVSPDLSFATGVGVGIEGEAGESLSLNGDLQAAINHQGFIPVIGAGNILNIHQEGTIGVCMTEVLADRDNPANVYNLVQLENGLWTVVYPGQTPLTSAEGLIAFGDEQGNPKEWMIAAVPNMFGNLEPVTLIVKDQSLIPESLKGLGYEFLNATVFTALIDPKTGEIKSLVPAIHEGEIKMSQDGQGKLAITVVNGGTETFELVASTDAFIPALPENLTIWSEANDLSIKAGVNESSFIWTVAGQQLEISADGLVIGNVLGTEINSSIDKISTILSGDGSRYLLISNVNSQDFVSNLVTNEVWTVTMPGDGYSEATLQTLPEDMANAYIKAKCEQVRLGEVDSELRWEFENGFSIGAVEKDYYYPDQYQVGVLKYIGDSNLPILVFKNESGNIKILVPLRYKDINNNQSVEVGILKIVIESEGKFLNPYNSLEKMFMSVKNNQITPYSIVVYTPANSPELVQAWENTRKLNIGLLDSLVFKDEYILASVQGIKTQN